MDKLLKQHPTMIAAASAPTSIRGRQAASPFAVTAELVALASLPESEVRTLQDVLNERLKQFTRLHPALTTLTWEGMRAGSIALLHPGMLDAVPTLRRTPLGIPGRGDIGRPADLVPGEQRATPTDGTGPWKAPRHWRVRTPAGAAGRRDPPVQFGAASTNQAPALTEPPPHRAAHPGTRPSPDPAWAPASSATPLEAPSPEAMPQPSHAVGPQPPPGNEHQPRGHPIPYWVSGNQDGRLTCHGASSSSPFWISSSTQCSSCLMARQHLVLAHHVPQAGYRENR